MASNIDISPKDSIFETSSDEHPIFMIQDYKTDNGKAGKGNCFIYKHDDKYVLITCNHVLSKMKYDRILIIRDPQNIVGMMISNANGTPLWQQYGQHDVAVIPIDRLIDEQRNYAFLFSKYFTYTDFAESDISNRNVTLMGLSTHQKTTQDEYFKPRIIRARIASCEELAPQLAEFNINANLKSHEHLEMLYFANTVTGNSGCPVFQGDKIVAMHTSALGYRDSSGGERLFETVCDGVPCTIGIAIPAAYLLDSIKMLADKNTPL